jgi:hypothetical protein
MAIGAKSFSALGMFCAPKYVAELISVGDNGVPSEVSHSPPWLDLVVRHTFSSALAKSSPLCMVAECLG